MTMERWYFFLKSVAINLNFFKDIPTLACNSNDSLPFFHAKIISCLLLTSHILNMLEYFFGTSFSLGSSVWLVDKVVVVSVFGPWVSFVNHESRFIGRSKIFVSNKFQVSFFFLQRWKIFVTFPRRVDERVLKELGEI